MKTKTFDHIEPVERLYSCKLSIERCQCYLAHLHALIYVHEDGKPGDNDNDFTVSSMRHILRAMERELRFSTDMLMAGFDGS
ncbi:MAG: hypothetical protein H6868_09325 [Rhodospirillales bacterium]|nr:hypothetical protein [Rhodospirillales bacterium]